jgi:hypothetical protein
VHNSGRRLRSRSTYDAKMEFDPTSVHVRIPWTETRRAPTDIPLLRRVGKSHHVSLHHTSLMRCMPSRLWGKIYHRVYAVWKQFGTMMWIRVIIWFIQAFCTSTSHRVRKPTRYNAASQAAKSIVSRQHSIPPSATNASCRSRSRSSDVLSSSR